MVSAVVKEQLDEWREEQLPNWEDHRLVDRDFLDVWVWFCKHLYAEFQGQDFLYRGVSFKEQDETTLMVLKISLNKAPLVAFVTARNTTGCVQKLRKLLRNEELQFYDDRYA